MSLFQHQITAIERGTQDSLALIHDPGCGKTRSALHIIDNLIQKGARRALVLAPISILEAAWVEDCQKFTPHLKIVNFYSKKPADRLRKLNGDAHIYVTNYEQFKMLFNEIVKREFDIFVIDESSKIKNHDSAITKAALALAGIQNRKSNYFCPRPIPHRYVLSGTPAPNSEVEWWPQIKMITGPGNKVFADNFYAFRNHYCYSIPVGPVCKKWVFKKSMRQELTSLIGRVAHVVRKEDAVDLPEQTHIIRKVYLSDAEQAAYDTFKRDLVLQFAESEILATSAIVEVMKLRQLTSGFAYTDTGTVQTGTSKLDELKELLEEIGNEQVIIWCNFRHEIAEILKAFPNSDALWAGTQDREKTIAGFKAGQYRILIANPQSAAHGLTFTNCRYAVYFSLNYSYELHEQSVNRIHRIGQRWPCAYYYLLAAGTIDEVIHKAVLKKQEVSNQVLNYLKGSKNATPNQ